MMDEPSKTYADLLGHSRKVLAEVADEREVFKARAEAAEGKLDIMHGFYVAAMDRAEAAEKRVAELEARLAEMEARADRNQGSADVLDTMEELMFGWEDDD